MDRFRHERTLWVTGARRLRLVVLLIAGTVLGVPVAGAIDWSTVPTHDVTLFFPGQSSWEWNLTESSHSGAPKIRQGKPCYACHKGEEGEIGKLIVSGKKLEPEPVDEPPTIPLKLQAAHDGDQLLLRLAWPDSPPPAGEKTRVTVMFDDGSLKSASVGGCWSTCHADVRGMPSAAPDSKMTKYLATSRTKVGRTGGDENYRSPAELSQRIAEGKFLEYWQAQLESGKPAVPVDGYVLKDREKHPKPSVQATASREGNQWVVVLSRPLEAASKEAKDIVPGKTYTLGVAVHRPGMEHRFHHVSFERTLVLDEGEADIVVEKR